MHSRVGSSDAIIQQYVKQFDMRRFLNEPLLKELALYHFPAYSHIYIQQDAQKMLYFLVKGQVQCTQYHTNGKMAVLARSSPLTVIGDLEIFTEDPVTSNVIAVEPATVLGLSSSSVNAHGADDPRFLRLLIDQLRGKLSFTNSLQVGHVLPVMARLVLYILAQPRDIAEDTVILPDKESLAALLGTTMRHLNRVLRQLVEVGGISAGYPAVRLLDEEVLKTLAQ